MSSKKRNRRPPARKSTQARPVATAGARTRSQAAVPLYTPNGSPFRRSVERFSAPLLVMLTQAPRFIVTFAPLVLVLLGFFLPLVVGLIALGIFLVYTSWLAYLSWPGADGKARLIKVAMFALVVALVVIRISRG